MPILVAVLLQQQERRLTQVMVLPLATVSLEKGLPEDSTVLQEDLRRNLLNKKEAPPSTIKESSESSQTIDDQDSDKDMILELERLE
uniref:Uncharacterized protein n=1 Tax=Setaria digitata TaxID=48799 RepID=A0A915PTQ6_9BILA